MAEITFSTRGLQCNRSLIGFCSKECGSPASERASNTLISSLGQLFITEAMPGKVIEIVAHRRIGGPSIFDLIQASLYDKFS
ncbi:PTD012 family protein, partial [Glycocaulis profundi]